MQICRGFTTSQWKVLSKRLHNEDGSNSLDEEAWRCAIEVFARRVQERFLSCIEALERADSRADVDVSEDAPADCSTLPTSTAERAVVPGFAIMALACLLAETLQSFRAKTEMPPKAWFFRVRALLRWNTKGPQTTTAETFKKFLQRPSFNGAFSDDKLASHFVNGVRNGILHEAETRRWVIWRDEPQDQLVSPEGRGYALNRGLFCMALNNEFQDYLTELRDPNSSDLRRRFRKKMDDLVREA